MRSRYELADRRSGGTGLTLGLVAFSAGVVALLAMGSRDKRRRQPISDAPANTLRKGMATPFRERTVIGRTVTINRPRAELYAVWREFSNLPKFMENIKRVDVIDTTHSSWIIAAPGDSEIGFDSVITEDRPNELIAWESERGTAFRNSGRVEFRDAPAGRGTEVKATIAYDPPGGEVGRMLAKLFQKEPKIQARRDLKRFKQLMETGEIAKSQSHPLMPQAERRSH